MYVSPSGTPSDLVIRPFTFDDIPASVTIWNELFPDDPGTVEEVEYEERHRDPARPYRQLVAERDGRVVAFANCGLAYGGATRYSMWIVVAQEHQRQGIGRHLAAELEAWSRAAEQPLLRSGCREDKAAAVAFLEALGFHQIGKRFESELDIDSFDETPFLDAFERAAAAGITFATFDQETAPGAAERLFELHKPLIASVPFPGGERIEEPYADWYRELFEAPNTALDQTVVAKRGDEYVGYSSIWVPQDRPAVTIMTGVDPSARRSGVALALKLLTVRIARRKGAHAMTTMNDTANPAILTLNQRMGYQPKPARLVWEKTLDAS